MMPESSKSPLPPSVEAWLSDQADADRRALEEAWRLTEHGRPTMMPSDHRRKSEVWSAVSASTRRTDREEMPRPRLRLLSSRTWRPVAAAAVLALLLGIGYMLRPITVEAPFGGQTLAVLPDGSSVELNSGSSLSYRATFFGTRVVELDGEAFFDVVEDDDAFVVETENARTTVLGTEFNVRSRSDEGVPVTSVAVASGRVRVDAMTGTKGFVVIEPGYRSIVRASDNPSVPAAIALDRELAWRDGALAFNGQPFGVIFDEIERRFDVTIDAPRDLRSEPYTVYLHNPASAEAVISTIAQAHGLRYRATANGYQVYWP